MEIEPALVDAVLAQVETGKVQVAAPGAGVATTNGAGDPRIEAPYLQLVLSRLWAEERSLGSRLLRLETLERLGGAERIVRTHLDATMDELPEREQDVAARAFRNLVTPSGTKIAHRAGDLAELSDVPAERLEPVLARLSGEARILRPAGDSSYEIYHDALAGPILHWRAGWQERQRRRRERRRLAVYGSATLVLGLVAAAFLVLFVDARNARDAARSRELAAMAGAELGSDPQASLRLALRGRHLRSDRAGRERAPRRAGGGERRGRAARPHRSRRKRRLQPRRHAPADGLGRRHGPDLGHRARRAACQSSAATTAACSAPPSAPMGDSS